jgi:hypothetical protein
LRGERVLVDHDRERLHADLGLDPHMETVETVPTRRRKGQGPEGPRVPEDLARFDFGSDGKAEGPLEVATEVDQVVEDARPRSGWHEHAGEDVGVRALRPHIA